MYGSHPREARKKVEHHFLLCVALSGTDAYQRFLQYDLPRGIPYASPACFHGETVVNLWRLGRDSPSLLPRRLGEGRNRGTISKTQRFAGATHSFFKRTYPGQFGKTVDRVFLKSVHEETLGFLRGSTNREELATLSSFTDIWHSTVVGCQFPDAILPGWEAFDLVAGPLS